MDYPTVDAYRDGVHLTFWCEHERVWHLHGVCRGDADCPVTRFGAVDWVTCMCPKGSGDGHRSPHCVCPNSPYKARGYVLREVGKFTPEIRRSKGRKRRSDVACCKPRKR